jgi:signal peptidase II
VRVARPSTATAAWLRVLGVAGIVVGLDQALKGAIRATVEPAERVDLPLGFDLTNITNKGVAFGALGDGKGLVLAVTVSALALVLAWFALDPTRPGLWLAVGLLAGGALGNLADRTRADAVTDYFDPPLWPAFNLADVAITLGALALVLVSLEGTSNRKAPTDERR